MFLNIETLLYLYLYMYCSKQDWPQFLFFVLNYFTSHGYQYATL
jgi:hypothetical protein